MSKHSEPPATETGVPSGQCVDEEYLSLKAKLEEAVQALNAFTLKQGSDGAALPNIPGGRGGPAVAVNQRSGHESKEGEDVLNSSRFTNLSHRSRDKGKCGSKGETKSKPKQVDSQEDEEDDSEDVDKGSKKNKEKHKKTDKQKEKGKPKDKTKKTKKEKRKSKKKRKQSTSSSSSSSSSSDETSSDFEDDIAASKAFKMHTAALPGISQFAFGEPGADWSAWVEHFENTVDGHITTKSKKELERCFLKLLPAYLNTMAHGTFVTCKHKSSWTKLKEELEEAFDDPEVAIKWKTDLSAYQWDKLIPLHIYKGNVVRYVNKHDKKYSKEAKKDAYFSRFVAGLPQDFYDFIDQQLYEDKQTVDNALRCAQKFKNKVWSFLKFEEF